MLKALELSLIDKVMLAMIEFSKGNLHDIAHLQKVHSFASLIGRQENLSDKEQLTLELAALVHDIGCPICREKYGHTQGPFQEKEGALLVPDFLKTYAKELEDEVICKVQYLVAHHHSFHLIGNDRIFQILVEADYLVNAHESSYPIDKIAFVSRELFKTKTGLHLLNKMYKIFD